MLIFLNLRFLNLLCGLIKDLYTDFRGSVETTVCMRTIWEMNVKVHGGGASFYQIPKGIWNPEEVGKLLEYGPCVKSFLLG